MEWLPVLSSVTTIAAVLLAWALGRWREREVWERQVALEREKRDSVVTRDAVVEFAQLARRLTRLVRDGRSGAVQTDEDWHARVYEYLDLMEARAVEVALLAPNLTQECDAVRAAALWMVQGPDDWSEQRRAFDQAIDALLASARKTLNVSSHRLPAEQG